MLFRELCADFLFLTTPGVHYHQGGSDVAFEGAQGAIGCGALNVACVMTSVFGKG